MSNNGVEKDIYQHSPSPFAQAVHNNELRNLIVAHALIYVAEHFAEFKGNLLSGHPESAETFEILTPELFDIYVMPIIRDAVQANRTQFGVMDIGNLSDVLDMLSRDV